MFGLPGLREQVYETPLVEAERGCPAMAVAAPGDILAEDGGQCPDMVLERASLLGQGATREPRGLTSARLPGELVTDLESSQIQSSPFLPWCWMTRESTLQSWWSLPPAAQRAEGPEPSRPGPGPRATTSLLGDHGQAVPP